MLNELFQLSESLARSGVNLQSRHRHYKGLPGTKAFFVELDDQGRIAKVSPIADREVRAGLRKYEKAAGYSFPSFNVPPLLQFASDQEKARAGEFKKVLGSKKSSESTERDEELEHLLSVSTSGWVRPDKSGRGKDEMDKLSACLTVLGHWVRLLRSYDEWMDVLFFHSSLDGCTDETQSFVELLRRAQQTDGDAFYEQLKEIVVHEMKSKPPRPSCSRMDGCFVLAFGVSLAKQPKELIAARAWNSLITIEICISSQPSRGSVLGSKFDPVSTQKQKPSRRESRSTRSYRTPSR